MNDVTNIDYCDICGRPITAAEQALGWPVITTEGLVCPSCYGDEAWCDICGELTSGTDDRTLCPACITEQRPK